MTLSTAFVSMNSAGAIRWGPPHFNLLASHHLCKVTLVGVGRLLVLQMGRQEVLSYCVAKNGVEMQHSEVWRLPHDLSFLIFPARPFSPSSSSLLIGNPVCSIKACNLCCKHFLPTIHSFLFLLVFRKPMSMRGC